MVLTEQEIAEIIGRVSGRVEAVADRNRTGPARRAAAESAAFSAKLGDGIYVTIDEAVSAARRAFLAYREMGLEKRRVIVDAMRSRMRADGERLAYLAREETGLGRVEDKVLKNRLDSLRFNLRQIKIIAAMNAGKIAVRSDRAAHLDNQPRATARG